MINKLKPNPDNPRVISAKQFDQLKDKIRRNPDGLRVMRILYVDGIVKVGNQRFRAIRQLHKEEGLEIKDDWFVDGKDWTPEQIEEFLIISNVLDGRWDWDKLANDWDQQKLEDWGVNLPFLGNANDPDREWAGMPDYENKDKTAHRQIIVSFKTEDDAQAFAKLLKQKITDKTKSLWYPEAEIETMMNKEYADKS